MIVVFGSINVDLVARVAHIANPGETVLSSHYTLSFGGKGANQAAAAAAFDREVGVMMIGAVGRDDFATQSLENFAARNIDHQHIQITDSPTGVAFISVDGRGENAITVASGANQYIRAALVPESVFEAAHIIVLQMEIPLSENIALARKARERNIPVIFNFAPATNNVSWQDLSTMLSLTDYLVVNEHEATVVAHLFSEEKGLEQLIQQFPLKLIVTRGEAGVDLLTADAPLIHLDAHSIKMEDTTGAGDFFVGTFAACLSKRHDNATNQKADDLHALEQANKAGAHACGWRGAQKPL